MLLGFECTRRPPPIQGRWRLHTVEGECYRAKSENMQRASGLWWPPTSRGWRGGQSKGSDERVQACKTTSTSVQKPESHGSSSSDPPRFVSETKSHPAAARATPAAARGLFYARRAEGTGPSACSSVGAACKIRFPLGRCVYLQIQPSRVQHSVPSHTRSLAYYRDTMGASGEDVIERRTGNRRGRDISMVKRRRHACSMRGARSLHT